MCCNRGIHGRIEEAVWSDLCALLRDPDRLRREFQRRLNEPQEPQDDVGLLQKSIAQLKGRLARLLDAYENGWVDKGELEPRLRRVKERMAREEASLAERRRDAFKEEELRLLVADFSVFAEQLKEGVEHAEMATRRKLLRLLVQRIEVDQGEVRIVYKVQPSPFVPSPASRGVLQDCLKFRQGSPGQARAASAALG